MQKAIDQFKPDVWLTNIRKDQTEHRAGLDILSFSPQGILKVAPFFYYSKEQVEAFMAKHQLPVLANYFDPVKANQNRECGIHFAN